MTARPAFADDILALFAERDAELTEVAVIQPADPFLDMAGEDLRRRIFLTESETGQSLRCGRNSTIPSASATSRAAPARRSATPIWARCSPTPRGRSEFFQAGIEDPARRRAPPPHARSMADAYALLARVLPGATLTVTLGDQAVFEAVLAALGLPRAGACALPAPSARPSSRRPRWPTSPHHRPARGCPPRSVALVAEGDEAALAGHLASTMDEHGTRRAPGARRRRSRAAADRKAELRSVRLADARSLH